MHSFNPLSLLFPTSTYLLNNLPPPPQVVALNVASIASSFAVLLSILLMGRYQKSLADRVSLRLTKWVAGTDMVYAISILLRFMPAYSSGNYTRVPDVLDRLKPVCCVRVRGATQTVVRAVPVWPRHLLRGVTTFKEDPTPPIFHLPKAHTTSVRTKCINPNKCTFDSQIRLRDSMFAFFMWELLSLVLSMIGVTVVTSKLLRQRRELDIFFSSSAHNAERTHAQQNARKLTKHINKAVGKIILYPIIPVISQFFYVWYTFQLVSQQITPLINTLSNCLAASQGLLNAAVFFTFDPSLPHALNEMKQDHRRYVNSVDSNKNFRVDRPVPMSFLAFIISEIIHPGKFQVPWNQDNSMQMSITSASPDHSTGGDKASHVVDFKIGEVKNRCDDYDEEFMDDKSGLVNQPKPRQRPPAKRNESSDQKAVLRLI
ncbi:hypothetical protein BC936DRAFT_139635 [Jimgerdemannia flammicorona]|uniref:Uncharacterized protein n=1 Tax=Jimgerdemannia flammicorona TaxID=994334 RepID=A0A433DHK3_9FUNG|nr:hypothetical protein BC936DRAFT_139635 [Jimgerdemannia flammicorona]